GCGGRRRRSRSEAAATTCGWTRLAGPCGGPLAASPRSARNRRGGSSSLCIDIVVLIGSAPILAAPAGAASLDKPPKPRTIPNPWSWQARRSRSGTRSEERRVGKEGRDGGETNKREGKGKEKNKKGKTKREL